MSFDRLRDELLAKGFRSVSPDASRLDVIVNVLLKSNLQFVGDIVGLSRDDFSRFFSKQDFDSLEACELEFLVKLAQGIDARHVVAVP